uniref:Integrase catalytic domain-containing protein n=1 Tax=Anopheles quadriannulatus TaxID=34691 RepID=A0A182XBQ5_ANOQN
MGILTATLNKMVMAMNTSKNSLLVLPNFDGVQKEWPKFRSIFYETAQTAGFTRLENLNRLQKHLRGDALKAVSSLMHDQNNLDNIMDRLEKLYGNPDVIYDALLADLTNAKEPTLEAPKSVLAAVRQRFWVVDLRATLKRVVNNCQYCKNTLAKPKPPMMAPLPKCRTTPYVKPFTHTGVDYFSPLLITIGRRTEKRWGVLFTCLTTRAVHIEIATDLSTGSFLICLKNMQHRRGKISHLYSDNGTNFVGASNEMKRLKERCASDGIEWTFNPPGAPHFGGAWERLVGEIKSLLPIEESYKEDELRSILTEIEFITNNRPLTHIPLDREDDEPLTPAHFLIGCSGEAEPNVIDISKAEATRAGWKRSQFVTQRYWDRWVKEYLPNLSKRGKWADPAKPLYIGDI